MDLFAVDTWTSDKVTDDLNSQLFGEVRLSINTSSKDKKLAKQKTRNPEKNKLKIANKKGENLQANNNPVKPKINKNGQQQTCETLSVKHKKRPKSSAQAEVVETNCQDKKSPGFKIFLGNELNKERFVPAKKKRKPSSKKNKYKHLDEIRKSQQECENHCENKLEIDTKAKLTDPLLNVHDTKRKDKMTNHTVQLKLEKKRKTLKTKKNLLNDQQMDGGCKRKQTKNKKNGLSPELNTIQPKLAKKETKTLKVKVDIPDDIEIRQSVEIKESNVKKVKEKKKRKVNDDTARDDVPKKKKRVSDIELEAMDSKRGKKNVAEKTLKKSPFNTNQLKEALGRETNSSSRTEGVQKKNKRSKEKTLSLRDRMMEKLNAARFRFLNEQLYTVPGHEALKIMQEDDAAFEVYHQGFQQQVEKWPENPVDRMIAYIRKRPGHIVADFGCGEAKIAQSVGNKVHSFDLVAHNTYVTAGDMANVPLLDKSVDIAVFCLSLMGTNVEDFLAEAHRVLKKGGNLLIAEVVSRFENTKKFTRKVERMGFTLLSEDLENKMFLWFELKKTGEIKGKLPTLELAPCVYKKR